MKQFFNILNFSLRTPNSKLPALSPGPRTLALFLLVLLLLASTAGATTCYKDVDKDGFAASTQATTKACLTCCTRSAILAGTCSSMCYASGFPYVARGVDNATSDCADNNAAVYPGATEICNGVNDNCINGTDEASTVSYRDSDEDTFGAAAVTSTGCSEGAPPSGYVSDSTDCNDSNSAINPFGDDTTCTSLDENCDGITDGDYSAFEVSCGVGACASMGSSTCVNGVEDATVGDCVAGEVVTEICGNNIDDDCDGETDEAECGTTTTTSASTTTSLVTTTTPKPLWRNRFNEGWGTWRDRW